MIKTTIWTGILLFFLGVAAFLLTGSQSFTALIPSIFGLLITICALVARVYRNDLPQPLHKPLWR